DKWIDGVKALEKAKGIDEILIPGEPEFRYEKDRKINGIPVQEKVVEDMKKLAAENEIDFQF
ncbi:MAG: Ldh family oxidoreductase, partial [Sphingobacteriales bacterium]